METIKLIDAEILLDNDETNYQSGQTISGKFYVKLSGELAVCGVSIVLRSITQVKWMEIYGSKYYREDCFYSDNEENLNVVYNIPDSVRKTVITAGEHSIPFEFELPDDIPSSIESDSGSISYWIEVIINGDSPETEIYRDRKDFTVESPIRHNLNLSVDGATEKDFGILSLVSGMVRIDASLKRRGHTPGETIEVHCLVTNMSTVAVTPRAKFYQLQIFMTKERHKTVELLGEPVIGEKVNAQQTNDQIISIKIPNDTPLSIKTRLISVKYFIHVTLDIPHAFDLHLNLPIIITSNGALNDRSSSFL